MHVLLKLCNFHASAVGCYNKPHQKPLPPPPPHIHNWKCGILCVHNHYCSCECDIIINMCSTDLINIKSTKITPLTFAVFLAHMENHE